MGRRRNENLIDPTTLIGLFLALGVIWISVQLLQDPAFRLLVTLGLIAVLASAAIWRILRVRGHGALMREVDALVSRHLDTLVRRRMQLVWKDPYGKPQMDRWYKEVDYFLSQQVEPMLAGHQATAFRGARGECVRLIAERVDAAMVEHPAWQAFSDDMTPSEFEGFCAEELRRAGWDSRVTLRSRDQGVDVIAVKGHLRVVLQCKLYARPVGNKAVQEATAARAFERANCAAVVSNNSYTPAAQQLAASNGILLLHYRDLRGLEDLLRRCNFETSSEAFS